MYLNDFVYEDGRKFNCVEQFFHAAKAELFGDYSALKEIMNTRNARKQKSLGRKVKGFVESEWTAGKYHDWNYWTRTDKIQFQSM